MTAVVDESICVACGNCTDVCPADAIRLENSAAAVDEEDCIDCNSCISECPTDAISIT